MLLTYRVVPWLEVGAGALISKTPGGLVRVGAVIGSAWPVQPLVAVEVPLLAAGTLARWAPTAGLSSVFGAIRFDASPAAARTRADATATMRSLAHAAARAETASPNRGGVSPDFETGAQKMVEKLQGWSTGKPAVQQEALRMLNLNAENFSNEALLAISRAFVAQG